jgi:3-oxoacyl-[acyl-carrier protein] reductase
MKNILIIGASKGIGLQAATLAKASGHQVYTLSRTLTNELAALETTHQIFDTINDDCSVISILPESLDGIIYCPGSITLKPFNRLTSTDFLNDYQQNVMGAVKCIQHVLPLLKKPESGSSIVLFSTVAVAIGMGFHASIASAKGAVEALGKSLAAELAPNNIRVNVIAPSLTNTPLAGALLNTPEKIEASNKRHPLQRIGTPNDIAAMANYLIGTDASWITGQVFHIDGGMSAVK